MPAYFPAPHRAFAYSIRAGIERFDEVLVFDRWGNNLADWKNIPEVKWDGAFRSQALQPAVFVYYIRFTDENGERVEKKGDVTIVR